MRSRNRYIFLHAYKDLRINLRFINVFILKFENELIHYIILFKLEISLDIYVFFYIYNFFKEVLLFLYTNKFFI